MASKEGEAISTCPSCTSPEASFKSEALVGCIAVRKPIVHGAQPTSKPSSTIFSSLAKGPPSSSASPSGYCFSEATVPGQGASARSTTRFFRRKLRQGTRHNYQEPLTTVLPETSGHVSAFGTLGASHRAEEDKDQTQTQTGPEVEAGTKQEGQETQKGGKGCSLSEKADKAPMEPAIAIREGRAGTGGYGGEAARKEEGDLGAEGEEQGARRVEELLLHFEELATNKGGHIRCATRVPKASSSFEVATYSEVAQSQSALRAGSFLGLLLPRYPANLKATHLTKTGESFCAQGNPDVRHTDHLCDTEETILETEGVSCGCQVKETFETDVGSKEHGDALEVEEREPAAVSEGVETGTWEKECNAIAGYEEEKGALGPGAGAGEPEPTDKGSGVNGVNVEAVEEGAIGDESGAKEAGDEMSGEMGSQTLASGASELSYLGIGEALGKEEEAGSHETEIGEEGDAMKENKGAAVRRAVEEVVAKALGQNVEQGCGEEAGGQEGRVLVETLWEEPGALEEDWREERSMVEGNKASEGRGLEEGEEAHDEEECASWIGLPCESMEVVERPRKGMAVKRRRAAVVLGRAKGGGGRRGRRGVKGAERWMLKGSMNGQNAGMANRVRSNMLCGLSIGPKKAPARVGSTVKRKVKLSWVTGRVPALRMVVKKSKGTGSDLARKAHMGVFTMKGLKLKVKKVRALRACNLQARGKDGQPAGNLKEVVLEEDFGGPEEEHSQTIVLETEEDHTEMNPEEEELGKRTETDSGGHIETPAVPPSAALAVPPTVAPCTSGSATSAKSSLFSWFLSSAVSPLAADVPGSYWQAHLGNGEKEKVLKGEESCYPGSAAHVVEQLNSASDATTLAREEAKGVAEERCIGGFGPSQGGTEPENMSQRNLLEEDSKVSLLPVELPPIVISYSPVAEGEEDTEGEEERERYSNGGNPKGCGGQGKVVRKDSEVKEANMETEEDMETKESSSDSSPSGSLFPETLTSKLLAAISLSSFPGLQSTSTGAASTLKIESLSVKDLEKERGQNNSSSSSSRSSSSSFEGQSSWSAAFFGSFAAASSWDSSGNPLAISSSRDSSSFLTTSGSQDGSQALGGAVSRDRTDFSGALFYKETFPAKVDGSGPTRDQAVLGNIGWGLALEESPTVKIPALARLPTSKAAHAEALLGSYASRKWSSRQLNPPDVTLMSAVGQHELDPPVAQDGSQALGGVSSDGGQVPAVISSDGGKDTADVSSGVPVTWVSGRDLLFRYTTGRPAGRQESMRAGGSLEKGTVPGDAGNLATVPSGKEADWQRPLPAVERPPSARSKRRTGGEGRPRVHLSIEAPAFPRSVSLVSGTKFVPKEAQYPSDKEGREERQGYNLLFHGGHELESGDSTSRLGYTFSLPNRMAECEDGCLGLREKQRKKEGLSDGTTVDGQGLAGSLEGLHGKQTKMGLLEGGDVRSEHSEESKREDHSMVNGKVQEQGRQKSAHPSSGEAHGPEERSSGRPRTAPTGSRRRVQSLRVEKMSAVEEEIMEAPERSPRVEGNSKVDAEGSGFGQMTPRQSRLLPKFGSWDNEERKANGDAPNADMAAFTAKREQKKGMVGKTPSVSLRSWFQGRN